MLALWKLFILFWNLKSIDHLKMCIDKEKKLKQNNNKQNKKIKIKRNKYAKRKKKNKKQKGFRINNIHGLHHNWISSGRIRVLISVDWARASGYIYIYVLGNCSNSQNRIHAERKFSVVWLGNILLNSMCWSELSVWSYIPIHTCIFYVYTYIIRHV